jgi:hypothetical protein
VPTAKVPVPKAGSFVMVASTALVARVAPELSSARSSASSALTATALRTFTSPRATPASLNERESVESAAALAPAPESPPQAVIPQAMITAPITETAG